MKRENKHKGMGLLIIAALLVVGLVVPSGQASATTIATLTNWNVSQLNATGDTVTVDLTGNVLTFTFNYGTQPPTIQLSPLKGIDEAGWTGPTGTASILPLDWTNVGPSNMDGFGSFNPDYEFNCASGATACTQNGQTGVGLSIAFTLNAGTLGDIFALHVQFGNGCSGFISNGTTDTVSSNTDCGSPVPEPASLLLLGSGLAGLGLWGWKRRREEVQA